MASYSPTLASYGGTSPQLTYTSPEVVAALCHRPGDPRSRATPSVMRYDLLLGGKHRHLPNNDFRPEILAALDRETLTEFLKNRKLKIMVDYLLEEAQRRN